MTAVLLLILVGLMMLPGRAEGQAPAPTSVCEERLAGRETWVRQLLLQRVGSEEQASQEIARLQRALDAKEREAAALRQRVKDLEPKGAAGEKK